jgi:hypothetical protein
MTLNTRFDFRRVVVAVCRREHRDVTRGVRQVLVSGSGDRRPSSGTGMTRCARRHRCDEVCRRFWRNHMSGIATVMPAIMTTLTRFERDHRMIHRRTHEGPAGALMAAVAIDLS